MLKSGKDSIFKLKGKKVFCTLLNNRTNCHQSGYWKAGLKIPEVEEELCFSGLEPLTNLIHFK